MDVQTDLSFRFLAFAKFEIPNKVNKITYIHTLEPIFCVPTGIAVLV